MKRSILSRYERDDGGRVVIDVSARRVEQLYNDFDKSSPYIRRDLDQDFVDYLVDSAREVNRVPFGIRLTLEDPPDESKSARVRRSLHTYFHYLAQSENRVILQMFRRSLILFAIGLGILFVSVVVNSRLGVDRSVTANVFAQGLTVAAWVSLWEALAIFLIEWFPHHKNVLLYRRLAETDLAFRSASDAG